MLPRLLSNAAFPLFYARSRQVVVSPLVAETLSAADHLTSLDYLAFAAEGQICLPAETTDLPSEMLSAVGAPLGVKAFVVDAAFSNHASSWQTWFKQQTGRTPPQVFVLDDPSSQASVFAAIAECMMADAALTRKKSAQTEQDLVSVRWDYEQALISLEKARRVIRGAGYDTRYATMSLPVGDNSIGPDESQVGVAGLLDGFVAQYRLPCDAAGIVGLSLNVNCPAGEGVEGELAIALTRVVDGRTLGEATLKYSEVSSGWNYFELEQVLIGSFGDCSLSIEWRQAQSGQAPRIALSELLPDDRAGENSKNLLPAMQIWSGFTRGELAGDDTLLPQLHDKKRASFADLLAHSQTIGAGASEPNLITSDAAQGWVQTHLGANDSVGIRIPHLVPAKAVCIDISCEIAHEAAPPSLFVAVLIEDDKHVSDASLQDLAQSVLLNNRPLSGADNELGVTWVGELLSANQRADLSISLENSDISNKPYSLACLAVSSTGAQEYGWCRWHDVKVAYQTSFIEAQCQPYVRLEPSLLYRMRSVKFPEIGEQLEFLQGQGHLQKLAANLGFSPMIVAEDNGSLQTHPLLESISAASYAGGAPVGTTRVACDVETAHERSPDFRYVLALMPSSLDNKYDAFADFVGRALGGGHKVSFGLDAQSGIHFFSRQLSALEVSTVSIELQEPLSEPHDIIVSALPVYEIISYGWCRWMSLSISSVIDKQPSALMSSDTGTPK